MAVRFTAPRGGGVAAVAVALAMAPAGAAWAQIGFKSNGPFETCLERAYAGWLKDQAELMVNDDPRAQKLDDKAVATWTVAILDGCRRMEGDGDPTSEDRFSNHMAQWRQHVFDLASSIRRRGQSD